MLTAVLMTAVAVMMMSVVITVRVGIIFQISFGERFRRFVSRTLDSSIKFDSGIGECHLRTHSDPTADQGVHFCCPSEHSWIIMDILHPLIHAKILLQHP